MGTSQPQGRHSIGGPSSPSSPPVTIPSMPASACVRSRIRPTLSFSTDMADVRLQSLNTSPSKRLAFLDSNRACSIKIAWEALPNHLLVCRWPWALISAAKLAVCIIYTRLTAIDCRLHAKQHRTQHSAQFPATSLVAALTFLRFQITKKAEWSRSPQAMFFAAPRHFPRGRQGELTADFIGHIRYVNSTSQATFPVGIHIHKTSLHGYPAPHEAILRACPSAFHPLALRLGIDINRLACGRGLCNKQK